MEQDYRQFEAFPYHRAHAQWQANRPAGYMTAAEMAAAGSDDDRVAYLLKRLAEQSAARDEHRRLLDRYQAIDAEDTNVYR